MKLFIATTMFLICNQVFASGVCFTKAGFDPSETSCEYNHSRSLCLMEAELCDWQSHQSAKCRARDPGLSDYCSQFPEKSYCNSNPECYWK